MSACLKHRFSLSQTVAAGTFFTALLFAYDGTFAASLVRQIALTTYLRDGPGVRYPAVDEAQTGTIVSVTDCSGGWCEVSYDGANGYVAQSALAAPTVESMPQKNPSCIVDGQASYHGERAVQFCQSAAPRPAVAPSATP